MASSSSAVNDSVILTEDDIPGASLAGRNPSSLKNEELRFWLRCRGDSLKGLNTKALLVKRYAQCIDFNSSCVRGTRTQPLICVGCSVHCLVSCAINKGSFFEIAFSSSSTHFCLALRRLVTFCFTLTN